jgi:hypothetical protein
LKTAMAQPWMEPVLAHLRDCSRRHGHWTAGRNCAFRCNGSKAMRMTRGMRKPASARSAKLTGTWSIPPPCSAFFDDVPDNPLLDYTFSLGFSHTTNEQAGSNPGFPSPSVLVQDSVYGYIDVVGTAPVQARFGNSFQNVATGSTASKSAKAGLQATGPAPRNAIDTCVTPTATVPMLPQVPQAITNPIAQDEQITGQEPVAVAADPIRPRPRPKPAAQETRPKPQPAESTANSGAEGPLLHRPVRPKPNSAALPKALKPVYLRIRLGLRARPRWLEMPQCQTMRARSCVRSTARANRASACGTSPLSVSRSGRMAGWQALRSCNRQVNQRLSSST